MKKKVLFTIASLLCLVFFSFNVDGPVKDWFLAGSNPSEYEIGVVTDLERNGKVAFLKSKSSNSKMKTGFGTIMQTFDAEMFHGKKVKLSGYIKSEDVNGWAGMWMRVDGTKKGSLSFDNMQDRPIKKSNTWKKYEIILDVPEKSTTINYGVLLSGAGQVWLDNLNFEIVGVAESNTGRKKLTAPSNANFEK